MSKLLGRDQMVTGVTRIRLTERFGRGALLVLALVCTAAASFAQQGQGTPVVVTEAGEQAVNQQLQLNGTVTAERSARLSVATSGLVHELAVDAGDRVTEGDVLLKLDAELARYQWQSAEAAQAQAQRALADARRRLNEARSLAPQQSIAESVVRDLEAEVLEDEAALQAAQAQAKYQRGVLERHTLRAPFSGVISNRSTELGEWVTPGTAVLALVATDRLRIDTQVPEEFLARIGPQAPVTVALADADERYSADVAGIVPVTDPVARTFLLRVVPSEPVADMRPGMSALVTVTLVTERRSVVVPADALLRLADGRVVVWAVTDAGDGPVASERFVKTGLRFDGQVEILSGLSAGVDIVVRGNEALREGQRLAVSRQAAP